jgi:putative hydrolase of HD superfamily
MNCIADLLFEAKMLKDTPRSGYPFLGSGKESVAEHSFMITFIAFVMSKLEPDADAFRLIAMCLLHDLPEARTGDMNYVHKQYVSVDVNKAIEDATGGLPFGQSVSDLIHEYNDGVTPEAKLAHDADQIAFILELKSLSDIGYKLSDKWLPHVQNRLQTAAGKRLSEMIMQTDWDSWWLRSFKNNRSG